ncbi:MAG: hypothetical protein NZO58_00315 [Gemmataceae bacterium]|nr:hypothetical protein [Gemmataceae bacterium]
MTLHRWLFILSCPLLWLSATRAGPVKGPMLVGDIRLRPAGEKEAVHILPPIVFAGGQPARVVVRGDHNPVVPLEVRVYSEDGRLVASDRREYDLLAVMWTPPRTAEYRIEVHNLAPYDAYERFKEETKYTAIHIVLR